MLNGRRFFLVRWMLVSLVVFFAGRVEAQWTPNGVLVSGAPSWQEFPSVISDADGGGIIAWHDWRDSVTVSGTRVADVNIYARRVSREGVPLWATDGVALCRANGNQFGPVIAPDGMGGGLVAWFDQRSGADDIYAQRISGSGVPRWSADGVAICTAPSVQTTPRILPDGSGGAFILWIDLRHGNSDLFAQRVNASGATQWAANGVRVCTAAGEQTRPSMVSDGAGGIIVAWQDARLGPSHNDVYTQRLDGTGVPQWTPDGIAVCAAPDNQFLGSLASAPSVVPDGTGGAIFAWQENRNLAITSSDVYAQRVNGLGVPQWAEDGIVICDAGGAQGLVTLIEDGAGGAIVTWQDSRGGVSANNPDIYAQRVSREGLPRWTANGIPVCTAPGGQRAPIVTSDGAGGAITVWRDIRNTGDILNADLYVQRVDANGVPQWMPDGLPVCTAPGHQQLQTLVPDGSGGAIVTWNDFRNGNTPETRKPDIYAQLITSSGIVVSVAGAPAVHFRLDAPRPNPSRGPTKLVFELPVSARVSLHVFDVRGRLVRALLESELGPGVHVHGWDGRDRAQARVPPGVYWVRLGGPSQAVARQLTVLD